MVSLPSRDLPFQVFLTPCFIVLNHCHFFHIVQFKPFLYVKRYFCMHATGGIVCLSCVTVLIKHTSNAFSNFFLFKNENKDLLGSLTVTSPRTSPGYTGLRKGIHFFQISFYITWPFE
jgi:hypothetical protein